MTIFLILSASVLFATWYATRWIKIGLLRWLPLAGSLTLMTMITFVSSVSFGRLKTSNYWREHTYEVLATAQSFMTDLFTMQRESRNYVLTGQSAALQSSQDSADNAPLQLIHLARMVSDNPKQKDLIKRIAHDLDEVIAYTGKLRTANKANGIEVLIALEADGHEMASINRTLTDLQAFTEEEHHLLSQRSTRAEADFHGAERLLFYGSILAGLLIVLANVMSGLAITKKEKLAQHAQESETRTERAKLQLQVANKELEAFSYSASHDLRAPLRHVGSFVQLLQNDKASCLSEKGLKHLNAISKSAKRMGILIDDLLTFSRLGQSEITKAEIDLTGLVRETMNDFQVETKKRQIVWIIHPLPTVSAAPVLLRLVLDNLISNALKFTNACAEARIEIGSFSNGSAETVIFIRDNGAGFDPKYSDKLFGVFQRLHSQSEFVGTGIGLANVRRIINRHGGRVWAEGAVNAGATIYFSIPKYTGDFNGR